MKVLLLALLITNLFADITIAKQSQQLLLVTTNDFNNSAASLQAYEKIEGTWKKVFEEIPVNLGRNGLAWGEGEVNFKHKRSDLIKQEGDGKAPAGLFSLDTFFGYEKQDFDFPYLQITSQDICVDDSSSKEYNKLIKTDEISSYKSFEQMRRKDNLYELGIVVGHNKKGIKKAGSCIFIHIQRNVNSPTAGCTSLAKDKLLKIMKWLKFSKHPVLLQLPYHQKFD